MERMLLRALFLVCMGSIPFLFRKPKLNVWLTVFFMKGVLASIIDNIVVNSGRVKYPVRPLSKTFDINILFDYLLFPLLSVLWVRMSYNVKPLTMVIQSLCFSVPMSIGQWVLEKKTKLFHWNNWTPLHTFASVNLTLWTVRGFVAILKKLEPKAIIINREKKEEDIFTYSDSSDEQVEESYIN
ncbi:CBO0543 family protein [Brevibacillus sp. SYSU BS000544]|uniref:CBO0543 family protein n=1 Tax=Brevibacillus sp. SYSU BS000544 TaxID=3416443 RepID=UPI003CE4F292